MKRIRAPLAAISLALLSGGGGAFALGGSAAEPDRGLSRSLVMVLSSQGTKKGACTGTVVAPDIILTAAHCVVGDKQLAIAYAEDGSHTLQRVVAKAVHPGYSGKTAVSIDLALVRLEGRLPSRFEPVTMDAGQGTHAVGARQRIAGFGLARDRDDASAGVLRSADVVVLPRLFPRFLRLSTTPDADLNDIAICTGDSGGPVFEGAFGAPLLVAVVYGREKFGNAASCGTIGQAVRLAPQHAWIKGVMGKWGAGQ